MRAAFWINPFAWIAVDRITRLRELACDDIASKDAESVYSYAEHLVAIARELSACQDKSYLIASTASAIHQTELKRRLQYILDARQSRVPSSVYSTLVFAATFGSLAAFCGACFPSAITETFVATDEPPTVRIMQDSGLFSAYVRDRFGEPIAGVKLWAAVWDQSLAEQDRLASEVTTNQNGYFEWRNPLVFRLHVTKFGYLNQQIEVTGPKERQIVLQDAYKIRGVVLGADSNPVVGAKVSAFLDADVAQPPRTVLTTDSDGKFEYVGALKPEVNLAAIGDGGQAGTLKNASSRNDSNVIQLLPPKNVLLRVKDHTGTPIPDAEVILGSWNQSGAILLTDKSNSQGEVVWFKAPSGRLVIAARSPGYRIAWALLNTQTAATADMTLYPPLEFSCTAVDSETGESVKDFIVARRYERKVSGNLNDEKYPQGSLPEVFRKRSITGDPSQNGVVTFVSDYSFEKMKLKIYADGFMPLDDDVLSDSEIALRRVYRLKRIKNDNSTEILVVGPDGKPASNVNVQVQSPGRGGILRSDPDEIMAANVEHPGSYLRTNPSGKFFLPTDLTIGTMTAWGEAGWFFDSVSTIDPGKPLALEPYSRIRIRLPLNMRQNKLARFVLKKNVEVRIKGGPIANSVWIEVNPTNEPIQEEIVIERAFAGTISLVDNSSRPNRRLVNENVLSSFEVEPGSEMLVDLTGTSKISGSLSLPKNAKVRLEQLEIRASTRGKEQTKSYRSFVQSDGFFEFNEISAGDYTFSISSTEIEPQVGIPQPLPLNFAILNLGIDLEESVAEGQTRDLGVVESKILVPR